MIAFDFVSDDNLRASLEADYRELELCIKAGAWKAVQVLAGSIIETILIDYLLMSDYQKRSPTDPLDMDLFKAIVACRKEQVISERTEQLSHAIRSYRNLIHPGRTIRVGEIANERGAKIAQILVEIIVDEISEQRKKQYGYTAEQIVRKLESDPSVIPILDDLLKNTHRIEMERLLLRILPQRYYDLMAFNEQEETLSSLTTCFRMTFKLSSKEIKKKVAQNFIRILKEESGGKVHSYEMAFFRGTDLDYLDEKEAQLVKKHLLSNLGKNASASIFVTMEGIGKFLRPEEIEPFIDQLIRTIVFKSSEALSTVARNFLDSEYFKMEKDTQEAVRERLDEWIEFAQIDDTDHSGAIHEIKLLLAPDPFLPDLPDDPFLPDLPDDLP